MINLNKIKSVHIACGVTDLRKSIEGLSVLVQEAFQLDPFSPALFVFCNRSQDKIKVLHWDFNGFWLYYKRLERGRFKWPKDSNEVIHIDMKEFKWILDGYELRRGTAFLEVKQRSVI